MYQVFHLQRCKFDKLAAGLMKRLPILSSLQSICTTCICRTTKDNITAIEPVAIKDEVAEAVTGEDLDEMFKNRLYNTETWVKVKEYQRKKVKNKHLTRQLPSNPHDEVSVIAKTILENVGAWQGEVNGLSESDSGKETVTRRLQANSVRQFPFELLSSKRLSSNNLPVADDSGFDVSEPLAIDSESCDSLENAEKIEDFKGLNSNLSNLHPDYVEVVTLPEIDQASDSNRLIVNESKRRWKAFYGTADPSIPPSDMPCGGCGALLHCQDSGLPGYMPSEHFVNMTKLELQNAICQRCAFLKEYNVALKVSVPLDDYGPILSKLQLDKALVILMIDLTDFPCSIWPGLVNIINDKQSVLVVGNKVDLLPKDGDDYLERIKATLMQNLTDIGIDRGNNIIDIRLISAFTGHGIEELITSIQHNWGTSGDIYLLGCTNVGKSSLFNALLQSDLCKVQALDLIPRATISLLPGTTLNLLKFPLLRPTPWRTYLRKKRLETWAHRLKEQKILRLKQLRATHNPSFATLIGHVGISFKADTQKYIIASSKDPFKIASGLEGDLPISRKKLFKSDDPAFAHGKWFYDTPGFINHDQILNLLTLEELSHTIPKRMIVPRCCILKPGHTFYLAGLGRIDYIEGKQSVALMVFASAALPISIMPSQFADDFYKKYLGTTVLKVPFGDSERLKNFPALLCKEMVFNNSNIKECCGDIILSSAGWISLALMENVTSKFLAYTPGGKGCFSRKPPLLKNSIKLRGKRITCTPFCNESKLYCY